MGMTAKTCSRLPGLRQGQALFLLSWAAYATAYVGRYNYSAVMAAAALLVSILLAPRWARFADEQEKS